MEGVSENQNAGVSHGKKIKIEGLGLRRKKLKCRYVGYVVKIKIEWCPSGRGGRNLIENQGCGGVKISSVPAPQYIF